ADDNRIFIQQPLNGSSVINGFIAFQNSRSCANMMTDVTQDIFDANDDSV
ncbi:MAG: hypothetical protein RLZZ42_1226, partial [Bacteroidota bacterium]